MVFITPFVGAIALLSGLATALPRPDSSINEPAVSAPNGTPITASSTPSETMASGMSSDMSSSGMSSGMSSSGMSSGMSNSGMSSGMSSSGMSSGMSSSGSSYGSSGSSSSNSGSGYGSSGSSGSSGSNYGNSANTMTEMAMSTSTMSAMMSYSTPSYGSGMSSWGNSGNSGYNNCVQQCVASFGGLSATGTYSPSPTMQSNSGSSGSGATHTVVVAPSQGVLRYVPFVVNASVGDTIQFMWGANNHTVTKSSELTPCNKTSDSPFASGTQNKGFMFTQVVNDTNPTFFYCGTPTHCQKGMFGIINPPNALGSPMSVSGMMQSLAANDSTVAAYATYTNMQTSSNPGAAKWGGSIDLSTLPEWSHSQVVENVLYTRNFLAANSETLQADGSVNLSAAGSTPLMIPQDLSAALAASASSSSSAAPAAATPAAASPSPASSGAANAENAKSGAMSVSSPKVVVGLVAAFATFLML